MFTPYILNKCSLYTNICTDKQCKFILKLPWRVSMLIFHLQGVLQLCQLKLRIIKMIQYNIVVCWYDKILVNVGACVIPSQVCVCLFTLHQRFSNCGPRTTSDPRVLPLWSFQIEHQSKKDRKNKINVNCVSHTVVENLKQSLEITYNKRL